jgi:predicted RNA binding protein YcfA (HicA-like mRNA interferase family)
MDTLPHLHGSELVAALKRLGFRVAARNGGLVTLVRRRAGVVIPENVTLTAPVVSAMVRQAGVEPAELLRAVQKAAA